MEHDLAKNINTRLLKSAGRETSFEYDREDNIKLMFQVFFKTMITMKYGKRKLKTERKIIKRLCHQSPQRNMESKKDK